MASSLGNMRDIESIIQGLMDSKYRANNAGGVQALAMGNAIPMYDPYMQAGATGLEQFQQGSTPEGLDQLLASIMGGEAFPMLMEERIRGAEGMLGAGGLTRSGTALQEGANIGTDLALVLEGILSGNNQGLAALGLGATNSVAELMSGQGNAIASGILGTQSYKDAKKGRKRTNQMNLAGSVIGGAFSGAGAAGGFGNLFGSTPIPKG